VTYLLGSKTERAAQASVITLEKAAELSPGDARILNDLAAAYFVRAQRKDDPQDLVRALDTVARAREAAPELPEVLFNLALIEDRLYLSRSATRAWNEFLEADEHSGWADDARRHLEALRQPTEPERWKQALPSLEAAALQGDEAAVREIVGISPQAAREYAVEELLGAWGERVIQGDLAGAERKLRQAAAAGQALVAINGERTVAAAVEAIGKARASDQTFDLARGHVAFRDGMRSFRDLKTEEAGPRFEEARAALAQGGSPMEFWALGGLARVWAYDSKYEKAIRSFQSISLLANQKELSALVGWAQWGAGWVRLRQGRMSEALNLFEAALASYKPLRENENLGAVHGLQAVNLLELGLSSTWDYWYQGLAALTRLPHSWRRHIVLLDAAYAAKQEGLFSTCLEIETEGLLMAEETGDPFRVTEAHRSLGKTLLALQRPHQALLELDAAHDAARLAAKGAPRRKLLADLHLAKGEVLLEIAPRRAEEALTIASQEYREMNVPGGLLAAHLGRARLFRDKGMMIGAEEELQAAMRILESHGSQLQEGEARESYSELIQGVYDTAILLRWEEFNDRRGALELLERARTFPRVPPPLAAQLEELPAGVMVLEYAILEDRLFIWLLGRDVFAAFIKPIRIANLRKTILGLRHQIQDGTGLDHSRRILEDLHSLLVPRQIHTLKEKNLVIIPDRVLNLVPFSALLNPETSRFLIEDHQLVISYSLQGLAGRKGLQDDRQSLPSALLVANPSVDQNLFLGLENLPGSEEEAKRAASYFQESLLLTGSSASKEALLEKADDFDVLVFAGHAFNEAENQSRPFLVLAPSPATADSGLLFADEVKRLRYSKLRLVVLSACTSVGSPSTRLAGLTGMARPFLESGIDAVVGSIWDIEDRDLAGVMESFYRGIARGEPAAQALRRAIVEFLNTSEKRDSLRWSALGVVANSIRTKGDLNGY
jgi:CHAT domain-containing protein